MSGRLLEPMNLKIQSFATFAAIAAIGFAATACQQAANKTAETPAAATSTTTTTTTTASVAPAAGDAAAPASATASNLPAECQAYLTAVQACVDRLSANNPSVAAQFRTTMDSTRASWASVTNQAALGTACTAATNAFNGSASAMGC